MTSPNEKHYQAFPPGPIVSLVYRVSKNTELVSFLEENLPFYEKPGGVRIGLYESIDEPGLFLELVAYEGETDYEADQLRVAHDVEMKEVLEKWHQLIEGPLEVRRMRPVQLKRESL